MMRGLQRNRGIGATKKNGLVAGFVAAGAAFVSYSLYKHAISGSKTSAEISTKRQDNISSELTATVLARALDSIVRPALASSLALQPFWPIGDVLLFTASCYVIMFTWFYHPQRMQARYARWITAVADMDTELLEALRAIKQGRLVYGEKPLPLNQSATHPVSPDADHLLGPMCLRYGQEPELGNTGLTVPIPCYLVHATVSHNCEVHAAWRFWRGFKTGFLYIYLPLNLLLSLKKLRAARGSGANLGRIVADLVRNSATSSAFLGSFIMLNWYCVCLARTRLGPKFFPRATAQQLEDTWGPGLGSALCGLSVGLESSHRRPELALFVFSKAIDILALPQKFGSRYPALDTLLFSLALGTLVQRKDNVKGYFGNLVRSMF
ncbi:hypothetical protein D0Z00_001088 [Geotrichum galactomycetum]|uniref:Uncharacterized protein n=1 Tax=Geotrichum galactomycetum TaxID=27317 RepID=A0ACB6V8E1_9ASCO|nr:hypothetical protein D0Z00_001088 [Geotrichum candidum]